jgi:hypothetical protein
MTTLTNKNIATVLPAFMAQADQLGLKRMKVEKAHVIGPVFHAGPKVAVYFTRREGEELALNLMFRGRVVRQYSGKLNDEKVAKKLARWGRRAAFSKAN